MAHRGERSPAVTPLWSPKFAEIKDDTDSVKKQIVPMLVIGIVPKNVLQS